VKSIQDHQRDGTYNSTRHSDRFETSKPSTPPNPPRHLSHVEKKAFREIAKLMHENESLSNLDVYALENFSVQLCLFRRAKRELEKSGEFVTTHTNKAGASNQVPSPWLTILKNSTDAMLKFGAKLGLSPTDRNKISKTGNDVPIWAQPGSLFK
jgi:P27 family predicted phage terminase small subunit